MVLDLRKKKGLPLLEALEFLAKEYLFISAAHAEPGEKKRQRHPR
jgi:hypothetical protein